MKQMTLLMFAGVIALTGFGCHTHHHSDHDRMRVNEPSGSFRRHHSPQYQWGHYDEHGVGRQHHRHYYRY